MFSFIKGKIVVGGKSYKPDMYINMEESARFIENRYYQYFRINKHAFAVWSKKKRRASRLWLCGKRIHV